MDDERVANRSRHFNQFRNGSLILCDMNSDGQ